MLFHPYLPQWWGEVRKVDCSNISHLKGNLRNVKCEYKVPRENKSGFLKVETCILLQLVGFPAEGFVEILDHKIPWSQ